MLVDGFWLSMAFERHVAEFNPPDAEKYAAVVGGAKPVACGPVGPLERIAKRHLPDGE